MRAVLPLVVVVMALTAPMAQTIDVDFVNATFTCDSSPGNIMSVVVKVIDPLGNAVRVQAVDENITDITGCVVVGQGVAGGPFEVSMKVDMTDDSEKENVCGMKKTNENIYSWLFKAYGYMGSDITGTGYIFSVECSTTGMDSGGIATLITVNVPSLKVTANDVSKITGADSFASGAKLTVTGTFYNEDGFEDATEIFLRPCYSVDSSNLNGPRDTFIASNGCAVEDARLAPTSTFLRVSPSGSSPIEVKAEITAVPDTSSSNKNDITIVCMVYKCVAGNLCEACNTAGQPTGSVPTGISVTAAFKIQDQQAQVMVPTDVGKDIDSPLQTTDVGDSIQIVTSFAPYGIGASQSFNNAKGFYVHTCRYATNNRFTDAVLFINSSGCRIPSSEFVPITEFVFDSESSSPPHRYVIRSGSITVPKVDKHRIWVHCHPGICLTDNNGACIKRCGADTAGTVDILDTGLQFTMSIIDKPQTNAFALSITSLTGTGLPDGKVTVGQDLLFKPIIIPGSQGDNGEANGAKGAFVVDCYVNIEETGETIQFVDERGCSVPGTIFSPSKNCTAVSVVKNVRPFELDCGMISITQKGTFVPNCTIGVCYTDNNSICDNRCAAGDISGSSTARNLQSSTAAVQIVAEEEDFGRTAIKSEETRGIIIALTVVLPVAIILIISIGACLVIKRQKKTF